MKVFLCLVSLGLIAGIYAAAIGSGCPNGLGTVYCFVDPCMIPNRDGCHGYPTAKCVANYCGGCNFQWQVDGADVTCH